MVATKPSKATNLSKPAKKRTAKKKKTHTHSFGPSVATGTKKKLKPKITKPLPNDLNKCFSTSIQAQRRTPQSFDNVSNVTVLFDNIEDHLVELINNPSVHYVLAAAPWFSSKALFEALATKEGVAILTQPDKHCKSTVRQKAYAALKPFRSGMDRVRGLRLGRGRQKSLMHSKGMVFMDADRVPIGASTGSFNMSGANSSSSNIEQMIVCNDERVASSFAAEWFRIYDISRRMFH